MSTWVGIWSLQGVLLPDPKLAVMVEGWLALLYRRNPSLVPYRLKLFQSQTNLLPDPELETKYDLLEDKGSVWRMEK